MLGLGVGDDDGLGRHLRQHLPMIGEMRHRAFSGKGGCLRAWVGDGAELGAVHLLQMLVMLAAHVASTDQGDSQRGGHDADPWFLFSPNI
jgi:hypothetical protein